MTVTRREFIEASLGAVLCSKPPGSAPPLSVKRRILAFGGSAFMGARPPFPLMRSFLALTEKPEPIVYLLPTADGDDCYQITVWYETMGRLPCRPRHLRLLNNSGGLANLEGDLRSADAVFVGGGNALNLLAVWRAQGVDGILSKAWQDGVLLAGESAGMICWFEQGISDSRPGGELSVIDGLGWLSGSACAHYHAGEMRRSTYHELLRSGRVRNGVACDDGAGVLFEDGHLARVVSVSSDARAYRVMMDGDRVREDAMEPVVLEPG